ncbi:MAG: CapA family protein, partial [Nitrolancea sp.]
ISADDTRSFPADRLYWETVLPIVTFEDRQLRSLELHPVSLGHGRAWPDRGFPMLADAGLGSEILDWMTQLSKPFGTEISVTDGVGRIAID